MNNKDEMKKWMQISESYQQVDEGILGILKGIGIAGARFIGLVAGDQTSLARQGGDPASRFAR